MRRTAKVTEIGRVIRPLIEARSPLTPLRLIDGYSVDEILRAVDGGVRIYDGGAVLLVDAVELDMALAHRREREALDT